MRYEKYERLEIRHWDDIDYSVVASRSLEYPDTHIRFEVYEISGRDVTLGDGRRFDRGWGVNCECVGVDPVAADAPVFLSGAVKWDGCSNWTFSEDGAETSIHFCDVEDAANIGVLFRRLYEWATELGMCRA